MPVFSFASRSIRVRGTPQALASAPADNSSGTRNSSRSTSPGCMGASCLTFFLAMTCSSGCRTFHSVVVSELDIFRPVGRPPETNSKLIIDPDGILTRPVVFQGFQMIAWGRLEIAQGRGRVEIAQ